MFEQHPVPQQISSYQFRLVGDMTLKQFFQLAAGAVIGLVLYASPLPSIFKWPLIIFAVIGGAAFAFLPLQERPLEEWISAFFRAAYGPTIFIWKKQTTVSYFASANSTVAPAVPTPTSPVKIADASVTTLENKENTFLTNITDMFSLHPKAPVSTHTTQATVTTPPIAVPQTQPAVEQKLTEVQSQILADAAKQKPLVSYSAPKAQAGTLFVATPVTPNISTQKTGFVPVTTVAAVEPLPKITTPVTQPLPQNKVNVGGVQAQFSPDAAPPTPATIPNVIVGQVMDSLNKIVEGAILEVKDFQGRPVRALKTNKAGHFMIVTPLPNGSYQMNVEKDGLNFDPINFEIHGSIVQPMAIKAKSSGATAATTVQQTPAPVSNS